MKVLRVLCPNLTDDPCLFVSWKDLQKSCSQERNRMKVDCRSLMNQQQQLIENERKIAAAKKQEEKNLMKRNAAHGKDH